MTDEERQLLARIDERTAKIALDLASLKGDLDKKYITRVEFGPVRAVVYGMVGVILMSTVGAIVGLVIVN